MVVIPLKGSLRKVADIAKLIVMVILITVLVILVVLNFQDRAPVNLIFETVYVWPSLIIIVAFGLGMLFTLLLVLIRKARKR